jgi:hypothetical protein
MEAIKEALYFEKMPNLGAGKIGIAATHLPSKLYNKTPALCDYKKGNRSSTSTGSCANTKFNHGLALTRNCWMSCKSFPQSSNVPFQYHQPGVGKHQMRTFEFAQ